MIDVVIEHRDEHASGRDSESEAKDVEAVVKFIFSSFFVKVSHMRSALACLISSSKQSHVEMLRHNNPGRTFIPVVLVQRLR